MTTTTAKDPAADDAARQDDPPAIAFEQVSMRFPDGTLALRDVNLKVMPGEFISLIGPSGCGKSTLLKIASGLVSHTQGDVWVDRENLGYTFQDATLMPWRSVRDNVELLMELRGYPPARRARIAREKIELVGLSGFEDHYPARLSGGMKMRVSLARSLALNPNVFMFDEPFGALDEITRERLNEEVLTLYGREKLTGIFVTHSIAEAVYMSGKVVLMSPRPGRIVEVFDVPFGYPRRPELRYDPAFSALCGTLSAALRQTIEDSQDD
ncbi:ABC transporter ATP-binding protein [Martelella alba]|nr:ABC transporter ATP-binding protein [Martelella alba]